MKTRKSLSHKSAYWNGYNDGVTDVLKWIPHDKPPTEFNHLGYSALCLAKLEYGGPVVAVYHDAHGWMKCGNEKLVNVVSYRLVDYDFDPTK